MTPATRQIVDAQGRRRTVPAHVGAPPRRTAGLADWLAQRRPATSTGPARPGSRAQPAKD